MSVYDSVLDLIGNTPVVSINHMDTGPCSLYIKMESMNPGGSIKDRIGLKMIEDAEKAGLISPGATLVEGTAGNTGLGLALVAAQKGYKLILVIPDKMSREKISNLKAMGATVVLTRSDVPKGHPAYYQDLAQSMADEIEGAFFINQFGNPSNPKTHAEITGPEIWSQMEQDLDALVIGVGSSGTATGLSNYFSKVAPDMEIVLADPEGSILAQYINDGILSDESGSWLVEGIGEDFIPSISDFSHVFRDFMDLLLGFPRFKRKNKGIGDVHPGFIGIGRLYQSHSFGAVLFSRPFTAKGQNITKSFTQRNHPHHCFHELNAAELRHWDTGLCLG